MVDNPIAVDDVILVQGEKGAVRSISVLVSLHIRILDEFISVLLNYWF